MRDIGANIRRARTRRRLTQDDLAQTVHTTRQTISNYETGRSRPDVETLQRLADVLGVELTELLDETPPAAVRRAVKLHKGNRQKVPSAGFLPVSGKSVRAPLQSAAARGILFSSGKHLSAIRGQFSSKQSEGTS